MASVAVVDEAAASYTASYEALGTYLNPAYVAPYLVFFLPNSVRHIILSIVRRFKGSLSAAGVIWDLLE